MSGVWGLAAVGLQKRNGAVFSEIDGVYHGAVHAGITLLLMLLAPALASADTVLIEVGGSQGGRPDRTGLERRR